MGYISPATKKSFSEVPLSKSSPTLEKSQTPADANVKNISRASNHNSLRSRRESVQDAVSDFFYSYSAKPSGDSSAHTSQKKLTASELID